MYRVWLLSIAVGISFGFGVASGQADKKENKKEEEKILGKTIGEWIKILREHENPKFRRAALIAIEYGNAAKGTGLASVLEAIDKDKDVQVRQDAVTMLGRLGPEARGALKALVGALQTDKADSVREAAATAIGKDKLAERAEEYVIVLADALKDPHPGTRIAIAGALRNIQSLGKDATPAIPALLDAARNPKEQALVRTAAIHVVSRHAKDNPKILPLLLDVLNNPDNAVALRESAIDGLSRSGSDASEVVLALSKALEDKNVELRKASAVALGTLGAKAKSAWPTIKTHVANSKEDSSLRNHLIRLTGTLGKNNAEAIPILLTIAKKDESTENRIAAIQELADLGPLAASAVKDLSAIATQDARAAIREEAGKAVKKIRGS